MILVHTFSRVFLILSVLCVGVQSFQSSSHQCRRQRNNPKTTSNLHLFPNLLKQVTMSTENGLDPDFPWTFSGRLWFRPAIVRVPSEGPNAPRPPASVTMLNVFGWTIGGSVALEYDDSPVGPYREYVSMGSLVFKRGAIGQWGSKLFVNTETAEDVCRKTWNVPAALADIEFSEGSSSLIVESAPDVESSTKQSIQINGWKNTRILKSNDSTTRNGGLPMLWTPSIKALWTPSVFFPSSEGDDSPLPLHQLRLSASAVRLTLCGQRPSADLGIPIPIGILVDNVLIEISRQKDDLL